MNSNEITIKFATDEQADAFREAVLEMEGDMLVGLGWYVQTRDGATFVPRLTADMGIEMLVYNDETDAVVAR